MVDRRWIMGRDSRHIMIWDALTGQLIIRTKGHGGAIDRKKEIAVLGREIWNLRRRVRLAAASVPESAVAGTSPDGRFAVIGSPKLQLWSIERASLLAALDTGISEPSFVALSRDADYLAVGRDSSFIVFRVSDGKKIRAGSLAGVWPFTSRPKGYEQHVDGSTRRFDVLHERRNAQGGSALWLIDWENEPMGAFSAHRPASGLRARIKDREVHVYHAADLLTESTLRGHQAPVSAVALSPDRWTSATGDAAGAVRLWDAHSGELRHECIGGAQPIRSLSFSPDGQFLLVLDAAEMRVYSVPP